MKEAQHETKTVVGIDLGSTHVSVVASDGSQILGFARVHNSGMRKGVMIALEAVIDAVSDAVDEVERQTGIAIQEARISVGGLGGKSENFTQVVPVKNNEVRAADVDKLISLVRSQKPVSGMEVIHDILGYYILDGKPGIVCPEGMWGNELSAIYHRITFPQPDLINALRACNQAGVKVQSFAFEALAAGQAVLDDDERELGVASVNIGAELSHVVVFSAGVPIFCKDYPIGSHHITKDLSVGLRVTQAEAERIKRDFASASFLPQELRDSTFVQTLENTRRSVTKAEIIQIVEPRAREMFQTIADDLGRMRLHPLLAKGVVISGGGSLMNGVCILAEDCFDLQTRVGLPLKIAGVTEGLRTPAAASVIGLLSPMFEGVHSSQVRRAELQRNSGRVGSFARSILSKVKDTFL